MGFADGGNETLSLLKVYGRRSPCATVHTHTVHTHKHKINSMGRLSGCHSNGCATPGKSSEAQRFTNVFLAIQRYAFLFIRISDMFC